MITKILVRPYRYKPNTWEADVTLLIQGHEVRRRWKSPMPSRSASERWAREKVLGFLANGPRTRRTQQQRKAWARCRELLSENPKNHVALKALATLLLNTGRRFEGISALEQARAIEPNDFYTTIVSGRTERGV